MHEDLQHIKEILTYIIYAYLHYISTWMGYSMYQQKYKLQISLNYTVIPENVVSESVVALKAVEMNWFHIIHVHANVMSKCYLNWHLRCLFHVWPAVPNILILHLKLYVFCYWITGCSMLLSYLVLDGQSQLFIYLFIYFNIFVQYNKFSKAVFQLGPVWLYTIYTIQIIWQM